MSSLPSTLNETYDSILLRISQSTQTHQDLVKTALRWIAVAQQPLRIEQLIEACTVKLEAGGQVCKNLRLSPEQIVLLLRHLVVPEKNGNASDIASAGGFRKDYLVFAHFSVREYLTTPGNMAPTINPMFAIELKQAHLDVSSSCIAYLLRTNSLEERENEHPLREYAWDLWALHAVLSTTEPAIEASKQAQDLFEQVAFGNGHEVFEMPQNFQRLIGWTDSLHAEAAVLDCLRNPYLFRQLGFPCF